MENKPNQVDEFFAQLPTEDKESVADIFDEKKPETAPETQPEPKDDIDPEKAHESVKDRRHRRLEQRLQSEREANIALNERVKTLSEMEKFSQEHSDQIHPDIAKMFDSSDVGKENAMRLSKVIYETQQKAKEDALREMEERQDSAVKEQKEYENLIDNELESLEDQYNVDLTSDSPKARKMRREFLELVQELSPKDQNGDITGYADFGSAFNVYQKTVTEEKPDNTRRQEIAGRSMKRSTPNTEIPLRRTPGFNGWREDISKGIL